MDKEEAIEQLNQQLQRVPELKKLNYVADDGKDEDNIQKLNLWIEECRIIIKEGLDPDDLKEFASWRGGATVGFERQENYTGKLTDYETALKSIIYKYERVVFKRRPVAVVELQTFKNELVQYSNSVFRYLKDGLTKKERKRGSELYNTISKKVGYLGSFISKLSEIANVDVHGKEYDMWLIALKMPTDKLADSALGVCLLATNKAIGKLEDDIKKGYRDEQGEIIEKLSSISTEPPKAFIAHGGDSPALRKLKHFLEALSVYPLVVEEQASEDRSVGENVDWYSKQADCAIILATKGDIDGKTGDFIPRGNVLMEIGKLQQLFKGRIIYLLQSNTKFPTNVSEKVWARFSPQSMDNAFIKVARELRAFRILRAVKPQKEKER